MTSLLEGAKSLVIRGTEIGARIEGLDAAVHAARGRVDDELVDEAASVVDRAAGRLRLSATHTVVAIAGATGSGKSSTFNALTGLELSAVGVRRPTTSWASACVWGTEGAEELLEWLGIPPRHQTTRNSMLDTRRDEDSELDGVVLLDLPDHDSTEVAHHLEVDRLVKLADVIVWVLDPQKYADAAIHDRYLATLVEHQDVMVVALNHIDTVPEERRRPMLDDVRRLLDADGLDRVPVLATSAKEGVGIADLKAEIGRRAGEKQSTKIRLDADVRAAAATLRDVSGDAPTRVLSKERIAALDDAFAEAAGVPTVVDAVERSTRMRVGRATRWPVINLVTRMKPDPVKALELDLGADGKTLAGRGTDLPQAAQVERARVDTEVRELADDVSSGLGAPWVQAVRRASTSRLDDLGDRLDAALAAARISGGRTPWWAQVVRVLQWLLLLAAIGGAVWTGVLVATDKLDHPDTPEVAGQPLALILLVGGLVLGIVIAMIFRLAVRSLARKRAEAADERLREGVRQVSHELVVDPIEVELAAYASLRSALTRVLES